jgi:hypothetical protein
MKIDEIYNRIHPILLFMINDISKFVFFSHLFFLIIFNRQENTAYYETKIQRLTKALDDKEHELRSLNMQLIT